MEDNDIVMLEMRKEVESMTVDEKLSEILTILRTGQDAVENAMANPMFRAMMP